MAAEIVRTFSASLYVGRTTHAPAPRAAGVGSGAMARCGVFGVVMVGPV